MSRMAGRAHARRDGVPDSASSHLVVGVGGQTASDLMASCAPRACGRRVRIGVADQVKKILGTGARGVQNFYGSARIATLLRVRARKGRKRHVRMSSAAG